VLVNGFPGTGKTTVAKQLSQRFRLPLLSKDVFKELMFDALGWSDKDWSLRVSAATHRIMDNIIDEELKISHSLIVEANFKPTLDSERLHGSKMRTTRDSFRSSAGREGTCSSRATGRDTSTTVTRGTLKPRPGKISDAG
jgi:hypothetical protein